MIDSGLTYLRNRGLEIMRCRAMIETLIGFVSPGITNNVLGSQQPGSGFCEGYLGDLIYGGCK